MGGFGPPRGGKSISKVIGYRHIPALLSAMESAALKASKKTVAKQAAVA
jgi:hypothetical protein